jgi:hypothetical protein
MRTLGTLVAATLVAAVAITTLAAPVAAAPRGVIAVVNGIPGKKIDVCINGKEIRSGLPYGGKVIRKLGPGMKRLKVFKKDPRRCKGVRLGKQRFVLLDGGDVTFVATKRAPHRIVSFDNGPLVPSTPDHYRAALRHAADVGPVHLGYKMGPPTEPGPAASAFEKHDERVVGFNWPGGAFVFTATARKPGESDFMIPPATVVARGNRRAEWIFVGTKRANARFVKIIRQAAYE